MSASVNAPIVWISAYTKSIEIIEDLQRHRRPEVLPEQQARPEGEDIYSEESGVF